MIYSHYSTFVWSSDKYILIFTIRQDIKIILICISIYDK